MSNRTRQKENFYDLRRKKPTKKPFQRILLVFEGEATEPTYFKDLRDDWGLPSQNIYILPHDGKTDPLSIVERAIDQCENIDSDFEKVFCVVDRDRHRTYSRAVDRVKNHPLGIQGKILLITSNPCFEVWFLLHFGYSTAVIRDAATVGSDATAVIRKLRPKLPNYSKKCHGVYQKTKGNLEDAVKNSRKLRRYHKDSGTDGNPSTEIDLVVDEIKEIKKEKNI